MRSRRAGAGEHARILREAIALVGRKGTASSGEERCAHLDGLPDRDRERLSMLSGAWDDVSDSLEAKVYLFILAHKDEFVRPE